MQLAVGKRYAGKLKVRLCSRKGSLLGLDVFLAVAPFVHVPGLFCSCEVGKALSCQGEGVVQGLLRDGVLPVHACYAVKLNLCVVRLGLCRAHLFPCLFHLFHAVACLKLAELGPLRIYRGFGRIQACLVDVAFKAGEKLPLFHTHALVHKDLFYAAVHAEGELHLADLHVAVQDKLVLAKALAQKVDEGKAYGVHDNEKDDVFPVDKLAELPDLAGFSFRFWFCAKKCHGVLPAGFEVWGNAGDA